MESQVLVTVEGKWRGFRLPESSLQAVWTRPIASRGQVKNTSKSKVAIQYVEGEVDKVELGREQEVSLQKCKEETHMDL